jgi:hypothetical protein
MTHTEDPEDCRYDDTLHRDGCPHLPLVEAVAAERHAPEGCKWFALCENPATDTRRAPWGVVPVCERCARIADGT